MRSKGSLWAPGSRPARMPCSAEIGSNSKPSRSTWLEKSESRSGGRDSLPSRALMAISQAEAAFTITVFFVSATTLRATRVSAGSSDSHHSTACVSSRIRNDHCQPASSDGGNGLKNSRPTRSLPFSAPGRRLPLTGPTGTRRATGLAPLAMTTSSPSDTF